MRDYPIVASDHAIDRYMERVRPGIEDREQAKQELLRLLANTDRGNPPDWLPDYYAAPGQLYAEIAPGIVVPLEPKANCLLAVTIMCRAGWSDAERRARRRKKRARRDQHSAVTQFKAASGRRRKQAMRRRIEEDLSV